MNTPRIRPEHIVRDIDGNPIAYRVREGQGGSRLSGHELPDEGYRPLRANPGPYVVECWPCGAKKAVTSKSEAKRWHARHKAEVADHLLKAQEENR